MELGGALVSIIRKKKKSSKDPKKHCWGCDQSNHLESDYLEKGKGTNSGKVSRDKTNYLMG